jgi:hypothetical protein
LSRSSALETGFGDIAYAVVLPLVPREFEALKHFASHIEDFRGDRLFAALGMQPHVENLDSDVVPGRQRGDRE